MKNESGNKKQKDRMYEVQSGDKTRARVKDKGIWKRFFHTLRSAGIPVKVLILYIILYALETLIAVKVPQVNANFFAGDANVRSVTTFIAVEMVSMVMSQIVLYVSYHLRARINCNLRNVLWQKILKLKPSYFDRVSSNTLISRITVDSESVNEFFMDIILDLVFQIYTMVLTIYEMSTVSIKAGLILLAFTPLSVIYSFIIGRIGLRFNNSLKYKMSDMTAYLSDLVSCLPLIKAFNRQGYEHRRGQKVINEYYRANSKLVFLDYLKEVFGTVLGIGPEICIILFGIKMLGDGTFDATAWYAFYLYAGVFIGFVNTLGSLWRRSKDIQGTLNKVSDVLYEEEECIDAYIKEIEESGDIIFENVSFSYDDTPVFENISFTLPKNKTTAIIGYSGSGKSTILKLIERIYKPDNGRILIGTCDINETSVQSWRKNIAFVSQNTPLLSGTIRENILYGIDREIGDEEIMEAARLASVDKFIESLEDGLDYEVGQFGTRLSGGQRQKISIARAILSAAEILVLDEPTASLDMISVDDIINTINKLNSKCTIIIVTHDQKAVKSADHIVVVSDDHTVTSGSADKMIMTSGFMKQLVGSNGGGDK